MRNRSLFNGKPSLNLSVDREPGSNVIAIKKALLPVMDEINGQVLNPSGMQLYLNTDDARYVQDSIRRQDGRRTVTLNVISPRSVALETAVDRVQTDLLDWMRVEGHLPQGVSVEISGASDQLSATREALAQNYVVALVLCYLVMVAIFTHWGWPLAIMTSVPLGIAGGIVGLAVLNGVGALLPLIGLDPLRQSFDMITMLGFLILLGVVVNNPILIVDRILSNLRSGTVDVVGAVREAVSTRIRPILMTMITTICGLSPLVFVPGAGTELYRGVGAVVLFGLLFATLVTLTFLPALLVTVLRGLQRIRNPAAGAVAGRL